MLKDGQHRQGWHTKQRKPQTSRLIHLSQRPIRDQQGQLDSAPAALLCA